LTWDEFERLTLAQFEALEERRGVELRQQRFNAALVTSTLFNIHRTADTQSLSPFDFIAGLETDEEDVKREEFRKSVKRGIALAFLGMRGATPAQVHDEKVKMIARLTENGIEDAEELIYEVYPSLRD